MKFSIKILFLFILEKYQFMTHKYPQSNHKQLDFPLFYSIVKRDLWSKDDETTLSKIHIDKL